MIKVLSYGLIFGGMIIKLPQIIRIMADKSVFGISIWSVALEVAFKDKIEYWTTFDYDLQLPSRKPL